MTDEQKKPAESDAASSVDPTIKVTKYDCPAYEEWMRRELLQPSLYRMLKDAGPPV